jgi:CheY-like chemotaxis protein/HPt (histidine-containing phosphotransfer) domain-containing protein
VETNLYVAKGLITPYGIRIDTAMSGFETIEKIKNDGKYDIIFMDHMMPKMDGLEATRIIREMGYQEPVVALTANALVGQAEIFMQNGFDDFVSKPIDIRDLNATLNRLIRDKQPRDVIKAAREQSEKMSKLKDVRDSSVDANLAEIFVRDAKKALTVLENANNDGFKETDDINLYVITVHAMKSALANVKEKALSEKARKLEEEGRNNNAGFLLTETSEFIKSLREVIEKLSPKQDDESRDIMDENAEDVKKWLSEKLMSVKEAAESYDKKTVKAVITEHSKKNWNPNIKEQLDAISEYLLHSDFDEIVKTANGMTAKT